MNCLIWNTQGAGSKGFRRACRYLIHRHKTDILVLSEPQILGVKAQEVCDSLNFSKNSRVEAVGASGGIWVLWNANETSVQIVSKGQGLIHAKVLCDSVIADFVFVCAPPSAVRRVAFWTEFEEVISSISGPAFFGGDFNCILSLEDRRGGSGGLSPDSMTFADLVGRLDLIDMGFSGSSYTWNRGPKDAPTVSKRLDRVFTNIQGRLQWTDACVRHLPAIKSDHNPIYLTLSAANLVDRSRRPFRFESMWTLHPQFMPFVESKWQRSSSTITALSNLKTDLQGWNREVFGNLQYIKDKLFRRIEGVERALANGAPTRLLKLQNRLKEELEDVLQQEEVLWFQKSRKNGLKGVTGIQPFFMLVPLFVVDGTTLLYTLPSTNMINAPLPHGGFPRIDSGDLLALLQPFSDDEIWNGVKGMGAHKAPGIDGSGVLPTAANETILHLIGKVASPEMVSQFRPISLCNVIYKMITKILSKRLQPLMDKLVSPMQSSFIPGRELVHSMNRKTGRKGWFIMKLDLEKAYDCLRIIQSKLCSDSSYVWRSILWALENGVYKGLKWSISDGRSVRFWEDSWLEGGPLIHVVSCSVDASILNRPVKDFWDVGSGWKWNIISNFLSAVTLMRLCAIVVQPGVAPPDSLTWSFSKDGMYTVSSAYVGLTDFNRGQSDVGDIFRVLWRIKVPERIRMFLWLGVHGRLMKNAERFRRHLTSDPRCAVCSDGEETLLHLFRDCRKAKCVWNSFGPRWQEDNGEFFSLPTRSWLFSGLRGEFCLVTGGSNDVIFAVTLGWVWRSRNKCVFGEGDTSVDALFLVSQAKEFDSVLRQGDSNPLMKMEKHISWAKPEEGWYKVNTDGAKESSMGVATAGGVIRDDSGVWLDGFVKNIGVCSVVAAELWGLYHGLELAWDLGYRKLVLESDSAVAIGMLTRQISDHHPLASLARSCQSFFSRDWIFRSNSLLRKKY
ncbi:hypothetical protein V2J09_016966 [Rumex salicifolius]